MVGLLVSIIKNVWSDTMPTYRYLDDLHLLLNIPCVILVGLATLISRKSSLQLKEFQLLEDE